MFKDSSNDGQRFAPPENGFVEALASLFKKFFEILHIRDPMNVYSNEALLWEFVLLTTYASHWVCRSRGIDLAMEVFHFPKLDVAAAKCLAVQHHYVAGSLAFDSVLWEPARSADLPNNYRKTTVQSYGDNQPLLHYISF